MPKLCEGCGYYSAADAPPQCPSCDAALKYTFLGPAGKAAAPLAGAPTDPFGDLERQQAAARRGFLGVDWRIVNAAVVALVTVAVIGVRFYLRQEAREERQQAAAATQKVRVGMHISEAARLLNAAPNMPGWRGSTRPDFDPDDDSDGSMTINDGRVDLTITWRDGIVTSVTPAGEDGTRRAAQRTTPADDEGDAEVEEKPVHPAERVNKPR